MIHVQAKSLNRRLGRFIVSQYIIDEVVEERSHDMAAAWCALFGKCVIIEARNRYDIEYLAYSEEFDPIDIGAEAPLYEVSLSKVEGDAAGQRAVIFSAKFIRRHS